MTLSDEGLHVLASLITYLPMSIIENTLTTSLSHTPYTLYFLESSVYVTSIYLIDPQAIPSGSDDSSSIGLIVLESPLRYSSVYQSGLVPIVISVLWVSPIASDIRHEHKYATTVNSCFFWKVIEGHLVDDKGELDELCVMRYEV